MRESFMRCENCNIPAERYRAPVEVPHVGLVRRHRCPNCRRIFMSLQKVISNWAAEKILMRLEEQDALNDSQTESSGETPATTPRATTSPPAS